MTNRSTIMITATLLGLFTPALVARADIFEWEYINPGDPSQGKQQSTTLAPDGAGVIAGPDVNLSNRNLTMAYLIGADLTGANGYFANLTNAEMRQANLTNVNFEYATLTGTNLIGADLRGANFTRDSNYGYGSGISLAQLYSTANYQDHDLIGMQFYGNDLTDANFVGQNLTDVNFGFGSPSGSPYGIGSATLSSANFSQAILAGTLFYECNLTGANFSQANLTGAEFYTANLTSANLSGQNLENAYFGLTILTNANLSGAGVRGANFDREYSEYPYRAYVGGITPAQLYSTASYQDHDLSGISLRGNQLIGVNLVSQNLTDAKFDSADLTGANLTSADARGAQGPDLSSAITANMIRPDGHIAGLDLSAGASLVVRDYDAYLGGGLLPIVVDQHLATNATGALRLVFDADAWDSTISFAPGIPVALGGTLELTFAPGVDVATQSGRTIELFDWTGVTPTGEFTTVSSPYTWNLSNLYTTGEITLAAMPTPEPASLALLAVGLPLLIGRPSRRSGTPMAV